MRQMLHLITYCLYADDLIVVFRRFSSFSLIQVNANIAANNTH